MRLANSSSSSSGNRNNGRVYRSGARYVSILGPLGPFGAWPWGQRSSSSAAAGTAAAAAEHEPPARPASTPSEIVDLLPAISFGALEQGAHSLTPHPPLEEPRPSGLINRARDPPVGRQEDAHEFLRALLGAAVCRSVASPPPRSRGRGNSGGGSGAHAVITLADGEGSENDVHHRAAAGAVTSPPVTGTSTGTGTAGTPAGPPVSPPAAAAAASYLRRVFGGTAVNFTQCQVRTLPPSDHTIPCPVLTLNLPAAPLALVLLWSRQECGQVSTKIDPIEDLQLDISRAGTLQSALGDYCKVEVCMTTLFLFSAQSLPVTRPASPPTHCH
jgi:hypothetical protein